MPVCVRYGTVCLRGRTDAGKPSEGRDLAQWIGTGGAVQPGIGRELYERYRFANACRFWGIAPWELEDRPDAPWWINEAVMIGNAEAEGMKIAQDIAAKKAKKQ